MPLTSLPFPGRRACPRRWSRRRGGRCGCALSPWPPTLSLPHSRSLSLSRSLCLYEPECKPPALSLLRSRSPLALSPSRSPSLPLSLSVCISLSLSLSLSFSLSFSCSLCFSLSLSGVVHGARATALQVSTRPSAPLCASIPRLGG